jgi:hypothetical protein
VLNDDVVSQGMGLGNILMIIWRLFRYLLKGDLEHQDSMGNATVIKQGDISDECRYWYFSYEYNKNKDQQVFTNLDLSKSEKCNPRYDQISLDVKDRHNQLQQILSPNREDQGVWIYQDAWFHIGKFDSGFETTYAIKRVVTEFTLCSKVVLLLRDCFR